MICTNPQPIGLELPSNENSNQTSQEKFGTETQHQPKKFDRKESRLHTSFNVFLEQNYGPNVCCSG